MKLTKLAIDAMRYEGTAPKEKDLRFDDEVPGFFVRVLPSGRKSFGVVYRIRGRQRLMALGLYGVLTLPQARDLARQAKVQASMGKDPLADRKRRNEGETFGQLAARYETDHAPKKRSARNDLSMLRLHILPQWKNRAVQDLTTNDVLKLHRRIGEWKPDKEPPATGAGHAWRKGRALGGPIVANRVISLLSKMFNLAKKWKFVSASWVNPVEGVDQEDLYARVRRKRFLSPQEARLLFIRIQTEPNIFAAKAIWTYLLTGIRKKSLLNLKWSDIDWSMRTVTYRVTKRGEPFMAPLTSHVAEVLKSIPKLAGNPYVFCGQVPGQPLESIRSAWERVRKESGIADARPHDLRRTVITWLANQGYALAQIGKAVDQSNESTTEGYAQFQLGPAARVLEAHGRMLQAVIDAPDDASLAELFPHDPATSSPPFAG
jgi:integrase